MHDIQSDMGHEGSGAGAGGQINDDDEEYGGMHNSGDGSGDGKSSLVLSPFLYILYINIFAIFRFHHGLRYHRHHAQHW